MSQPASFKFTEILMAVLILGAVGAGILSSEFAELGETSNAEHHVPAESSWDENIEYYSFSAADLRAAHTNMFRASPIVIGGRKFSGVMKWEWEWRAKYTTLGGQCVPERVITRAVSTIILPKWENYEDASYSERREWDRAQKVLLRHEKKHERIAKMAVAEFERKANALGPEDDCDAVTASLNLLFDRYMGLANHQNKSYDKRTDHGRTEGTVLRLPNFVSGY